MRSLAWTVAIGAAACVLVGGMALAQQRPQAARDRVEHPMAEFAGLDKITGRIIKFEVRIGETVQFGALQVTPRACAQRLTGNRDHVGFIEVDEITLRNEIRRIFGGWMFAASPGLNAVEHPIYDIWLAECKGGNVPQMARGPVTGAQGEDAPPEGTPTPRRPTPQQRRQQQPPAAGEPAPAPRRQPIQPGVPFDPAQVPRR